MSVYPRHPAQRQPTRGRLPGGDLRLPDGRVLRPILGHDTRKLPQIDAATRAGILASKGWRHDASAFTVTATLDNTDPWGPLVHVAMSYPDHDPTWDEIKAVRALFFPDHIDAMMVLPAAHLYVNVSPHCFHLAQTPQPWGIG